VPVLARRLSETIFLPEVGVTMQVLNAVDDRIRIALHVPDTVELLAEAFATDAAVALKSRRCTRVLSRQQYHDLKNDLHAIRLTLHVFDRQQASGRTDAAAATFDRLTRQVKSLRDLLPHHGDHVEPPSLLDIDDVH
jgi:sRNA-binding carbon storage regulator CsrA